MSKVLDKIINIVYAPWQIDMKI